MEFTYDGFVRYGFGFQNPNHAAALFAALLPICWGLRAYFDGRRWRYAVLSIELLLYVVLALTYSRAGIVAALFAALLFYMFRSDFKQEAFFARARQTLLRRSFWISLGVFAAAAISLGALKRYYLWIFQQDSSVGNRFDLWHGSLRMMAENPLGVGTGESGRIYTLFYMPDGLNLGYRTLVNSFLTFIAEQGMPLAGISFALAFSILILGVLNFKSYGSASKLAAISCFSVIGSLFVSGMLSTCLDLSELMALCGGWDLNAFMQSSLLAIGVAAFLILGALCLPHVKWKNAVIGLACGIGVSIVMLATIWVGGSLEGGKEVKCKIIRITGGSWAWIPAGKQIMLILPDNKALSLRQTLAFAKSGFKGYGILMPLEKTAGKAPFECQASLLCGRNASRLSSIPGDAFILRPRCLPPREGKPLTIKRIWLDPLDEFGVNGVWEAFAPNSIASLSNYP